MPSLDPAAVVAQVDRLGSLPEIQVRISEIIEHPRSSMADVAEALASDPDTVAQVLRIANSALFGFPGRIEDVARALTVIGVRQLHDLLRASAVIRVFAGIDPERVDMRSFWSHSIATALAGRALAAAQLDANQERAFLAGIIHDVGRLVLFEVEPTAMDEVLDHAHSLRRPLIEVEHEFLGTDHAAVGAALLQRWQMPGELASVIRCHHRPPISERDTCILHLSDAIAHAMELGHAGFPALAPIREEAWQALGIPLQRLSPIIEVVDQQHAAAVATFLPNSAVESGHG